MATAVAPKLMTADELLELPDSRFLELVNGRIREMAPAGMEHSEHAAELLSLIRNFVREHDLGTVVGEAGGFVLKRDPDTVRAADVAFISKARAEAGRTRKYFDGAPDLAIEVISPHDLWSEVVEKCALWMKSGSQSVWVLDPDKRVMYRYTDGALAPFGESVLDPVLPGFSLEVAALFRR